MNIFVTGAPGWLGTRCVEMITKKEFSCQKNDYSLKCLVLGGSDGSYLKALNAEIVYGDVRVPASFKGAIDGCDYVIHAAGIIHPKRIQDLYEVNYIGTRNIIQEAISAGVKRMVYISSNSSAGFSREGQLFSEADPAHPYMEYGKSKYLAECAVMEAVKSAKIEAVILRPCWFYGPRQPDRQTRFFQMIKKGNPVLFGDGSNLRSVSYIDNIVQGIILALEKDGINGEIYWIADENPYTVLEMYQTISGLLGINELRPKKIPGWSSWVFEQIDAVLQCLGLYIKEVHVAGEMSRNIACSVEKAKKELGYEPGISLKEGMRRSINWCRDNGEEI